MMEQMMQRPRNDRRRERTRERRRNESRESDLRPEGLKEKVIYYTAVFLRVALWLAIAWALSHLHMGVPCFVLTVLVWVYSEPLKALFSRVKRRQKPDQNQDKTQ